MRKQPLPPPEEIALEIEDITLTCIETLKVYGRTGYKPGPGGDRGPTEIPLTVAELAAIPGHIQKLYNSLVPEAAPKTKKARFNPPSP